MDQIPGNILIEVSKIISSPLSELINRSFSDGVYPTCLKQSKIIPIYKNKGTKNNVENYRPIAVQSQFGKIFERLFNDRLTMYLEKYSLLCTHQNGFRLNYSTETAISQALECVHNNLNNKQKIFGLFFDMSRAFDTVDHELLLAKAERFGIRGNAHKWLKSYLTNRTAKVVIGGVESRAHRVQLGTPQGSCISPTLFNIFINSLPKALSEHATPVLYADDTNVLLSAPCQSQLLSTADSVIHTMQNWCREAGVQLNADKTMGIEFAAKNSTLDYSYLMKMGGKSVRSAASARFLGLCIDQKLTWSFHVNSILPKLSSCCFLIKSIRNTVSMEVLKLAYFGLFQSALMYGVVFWGHAHEADRVFVTQKRAVRYMCGVVQQRTSCRPLFRRLHLLAFPCLYIYSLIIYVKKSGYDIKRQDFHSYDTRAKCSLQLPFERLTATQYNPRYIGVKLINHLQRINKNLTEIVPLHVFKNNLKHFLIEKCYYSIDEFLSDGTGVG